MLDNFVAKHDRLLRHLGVQVEEAGPEYARVRMSLRDEHHNGMGAVHGGIICTLCDAAFGAAANSNTPVAVVTLSLAVDFLKPGFHGPLKAEAFRVHQGKHVVNYRIEVRDANEVLVASSVASGYITSVPLEAS